MALFNFQKREIFTDCHIHAEKYAPEEWLSVFHRAQEAGVTKMILSGMDLNTSMEALMIADTSPDLLVSVGLHPWLAVKGLPQNLIGCLESLALNPKVVAIGEIGLDLIDNCAGLTFFDNQPLVDLQVEAFRLQIKIAVRHHLPLIVHARGAYSQVISVLEEEKAKMVGGVIHNFQASSHEAEILWKLGFYVSFGGAITYPEAFELQETVKNVPLKQILIETDSPYMPLYKQVNEKNEPANVIRIAQKLAELKRLPLEEVTKVVYSNFFRLFGKAKSK
ncbi:MAG: TatD family hydrolase, partial [Nitrososphaerota archaeon]